MGRTEIKRAMVSGQCACKGHNAKYKILIKGINASPQSEVLLCKPCFDDLKEKINNSN